jgi:chemotaxis protein MotB
MKKGPPPKAEKDRSERWLLTYSDLITLLMIFFIVLYSMSSVDAKKFEQMSQSLSIAFGSVGRSGVLDAGRAIIPGDQVYKERRSMQNTEEKIRRMIAQKGLEGKVSTELTDRGLVISLRDSVLFTAGASELNEQSSEIVAGVAHILSSTPNAIRVEGHTDTVPIHTDRFPSNWELSTSRAISVLRFFIQHGGIPPERLSAAGYGEYKPAFPNTSEHNRALNRRVDIVLLSSAYAKFEPEGAKLSVPDAEGEQTEPSAPAPDTAVAPPEEF